MIPFSLRLLGFARKVPWWVFLIAGLAAFLWVQTARMERWEAKAKAEAQGRRDDAAAYVSAQELAGAKAKAAKEAFEDRSTKLAKEADNANENAVRWRDAADRYRVRAEAAGRASGGTAGDAQGGLAQGSDGPGETALVCLSGDDFDILSENTERLIRVHDWGVGLIAEGLAE